jgi:hypothetical protein
MTQFNFKKWNTILGWFSFLIALITYSLTVEPTVSFWDAGEYILTASKLQVGHPPGAPLFQMLGAFFSIFALEPSQIGLLMNMMSAVSSAFTILFMFWTISLLLKKVVANDSELNENQSLAILGSALVGSLAFTFTDSFWFNAVETEVYAMATLIMSILFWLGLRWEQDMDKPRGNRWLILIAFVIGLSFGVHFMGLLTIPAIGLIYYFKNYKEITIKNFIIANVATVAILLFIFKLLAPNILRFFSVLEMFFVNSIGLPFNSGSIIAGILLIGLIYFGLQYTRKKNYVHLNTAVLCLTFIIIGFSSWTMLPIRANANVVINENNPSSARELLAYYNLEQYPETHLFYGPQFTDQYSGLDAIEPYVDDKPKYEKDLVKGEYVIVNDYKNAKQNYNHKHASILPRMWSPENAENYLMFTGILDFKLKPEVSLDHEQRSNISEIIGRYQSGEISESDYENFITSNRGLISAYFKETELKKTISDFKSDVSQGLIDYEDYNNFLKQFGQYIDIEKPSLMSNIVYLFEYQLGYMYWRYFMWNFTGRQDDIQGRYTHKNGNWISGINLVDNIHIGMSQDNLPTDVLENKSRNTYYFLPLILGLVGFFFLMYSDLKRFWVLLVFFLLTGLAIQFYTNVRPFEPRERDYSVVGSFYVFAIWIGFGVYAIYDLLQSSIKTKLLAPVITLACLIIVPGVLAANNWDDHDRSGKYTTNSMARKYLESCAPNAILFTIGDNDTFPLWYLQEIEGVRTDVRVVNTSLFQTDWYIDQMKRKAYDSDPIPSQLTHNQYRGGTRDVIIRREITKDTLPIKDFMDFISSEKPSTKFRFVTEKQGEDPSQYPTHLLNSNYFPTRSISIPVNKDAVLKNGVVKQKDADKIEDNLYTQIEGSYIYKNRLLMLDIIANNNWERPIYFTGGAFGAEDYVWLKDYLQLDGMCYKLVPIKTAVDRANPYDMGRVDPDLMYDMVKNWKWGGSGEDIYYDIETRRNGITYRGNLARLIEQLINEEELDKAEEIADIAMEKMPVDKFGFYSLLEPYVSAYYEIGNIEKGRALYKDVAKKYQENLMYYSSLTIENQDRMVGEDLYLDIQRYRSLIDILVVYNDKEFALQETKTFNSYLSLFDELMNSYNESEDFPEVPEDLDIQNTIKDTIERIAPEN